jgi:hypothetical protein
MKSQIPSTKLQINYKFQYPMTKTCLELSSFKIMYRFGILKLGTRAQGGESNRSADNFGHCDLFVICDLEFVIFNRFSCLPLANPGLVPCALDLEPSPYSLANTRPLPLLVDTPKSYLYMIARRCVHVRKKTSTNL